MFGSAILDVAIGMALVYLLLSLIASAIQETIAAVLQSRSANLLQGLHSLFSGDKAPNGTHLLEALYDHGLIRGLYKDPKIDSENADAKVGWFDRFRMILQNAFGFGAPSTGTSKIFNRMLLPSYIPSGTFALALTDILTPADGKPADLESLRTLLAEVKGATPNKALEALSALAASSKDLAEFQRRVENWYNDAMNRVSGWYKKYTQKVLIVIGLVLAIAFNVNTILLAKTLWTDKDAREAFVEAAKQYVKPDQSKAASPAPDAKNAQTASPEQPDEWEKLRLSIGKFQAIEDKNLLPIGWNDGVYPDADPTISEWHRWIYAVVGWLFTALALSLGASFWFDTLNKFMVIRGTIKPDEKSQPEPSKDK